MATAPKLPSAERKGPIPISSHSSASLPVIVDNFVRAESDMYFSNVVHRLDGGFAKFTHYRLPTPIDQQDVIRMNRDTLYSGAVRLYAYKRED